MRRILLALLSILRPIRAALLPPSCRFTPTCSAYAVDALQTYPTMRALRLILSRLLRCHPFHPGGIDPVPTP
jgi:putative membrane protein insertion efficiency factor